MSCIQSWFSQPANGQSESSDTDQWVRVFVLANTADLIWPLDAVPAFPRRSGANQRLACPATASRLCWRIALVDVLSTVGR